jgi:hypothetical protein
MEGSPMRMLVAEGVSRRARKLWTKALRPVSRAMTLDETLAAPLVEVHRTAESALLATFDVSIPAMAEKVASWTRANPRALCLFSSFGMTSGSLSRGWRKFLVAGDSWFSGGQQFPPEYMAFHEIWHLREYFLHGAGGDCHDEFMADIGGGKGVIRLVMAGSKASVSPRKGHQFLHILARRHLEVVGGGTADEVMDRIAAMGHQWMYHFPPDGRNKKGKEVFDGSLQAANS